MTRQIYDKDDYPRSKVGDPLTTHWTVRRLTVNGKKGDFLVRKHKGKKQMLRMKDKRMSKQISFTDAKKIHEKRSKRARTMDNKHTHKNTKHFADKNWARNPSLSDVSGIDTKKRDVK